MLQIVNVKDIFIYIKEVYFKTLHRKKKYSNILGVISMRGSRSERTDFCSGRVAQWIVLSVDRLCNAMTAGSGAWAGQRRGGDPSG